MSAPRGRCANEENARAFHQGPDTVGVHREAGYIDAALFSMVYHVTPVVVSKAGSIYHFVFNATSQQLIPATPAKVRIFCKPSLEWACSLSISPPQPAHLGHLHPSLTLPHGRPSPLTSVGGSESSTPTRHLGWHFRPHSSQVLNAIRYTDVIQSNTLLAFSSPPSAATNGSLLPQRALVFPYRFTGSHNTTSRGRLG